MFKNLDIEFCRKVLDFAEAEHEGFTHYQQSFYDVDANWDDEKEEYIVCGTTACMAGIACMLDPNPSVKISKMGLLTVDGEPAEWEDVARQSMGLTYNQSRDLFFDTCNDEHPEHAARGLLRSYIERAEVERLHQ